MFVRFRLLVLLLSVTAALTLAATAAACLDPANDDPCTWQLQWEGYIQEDMTYNAWFPQVPDEDQPLSTEKPSGIVASGTITMKDPWPDLLNSTDLMVYYADTSFILDWNITLTYPDAENPLLFDSSNSTIVFKPNNQIANIFLKVSMPRMTISYTYWDQPGSAIGFLGELSFVHNTEDITFQYFAYEYVLGAPYAIVDIKKTSDLYGSRDDIDPVWIGDDWRWERFPYDIAWNPEYGDNRPGPLPPEFDIGFSAFNITEAKVKFKDNPNDDEFKIKGQFVLGDSNNGIDPVNEEVTVNVGTSSIVIPSPFSFAEETAGRFKFNGTVNGSDVEMNIKKSGFNTFDFKIKVKGTDLTDTSNPVDVGLTIGNDAGTTNVRLKGVLMFGNKHKHK